MGSLRQRQRHNMHDDIDTPLTRHEAQQLLNAIDGRIVVNGRTIDGEAAIDYLLAMDGGDAQSLVTDMFLCRCLQYLHR